MAVGKAGKAGKAAKKVLRATVLGQPVPQHQLCVFTAFGTCLQAPKAERHLQPQHKLRDDVLLNLVAAAGDGIGPQVEVPRKRRHAFIWAHRGYFRAHLVDHVFPEVPVRQWVLSFPWPLRLLFASQPDALGRCLSVIIRAIQTNLAHRAGLTASAGARTGVVTLIQRFGSALNLNVHLHMLILDGVYTMEQNGPRFHRVRAPNTQTLERLLNRLIQRIVRRLTRDGLLIEDPEQTWLDLEPTDTLDHLNAASIRYRMAVGQGAGGRTLTLKNPALARTDSTPKPFTANQNGFSLNCAVSCQAHQRDRLERLCRYITRPALCLERLSTNVAGQVVYQLKNPFRDGTTHVLFSPADFVARLAALVPRPRINLTRYHGVFAPSSPMRSAIVPTPANARQRRRLNDSAIAPATRHQNTAEPPADTADTPTAPLTWAQRLRRVFEIDITLCPFCGGQLRVIADVTDPDLIRKILDHVNSRAPPRLHAKACRAPPKPSRSVRQTLKSLR